MKRVIIFGDSLIRPRPDILESEKTVYEDTYAYKLKSFFENQPFNFEVDILYIESLDSGDAKFWSERMVAFRNPDIVIFHLGINDCAPRLFKKNSKSILLNQTVQRITKNLVLRLLSRYRYFFTKFFPKVYVELKEFEANMLHMMHSIKMHNSREPIFFALSIAYSEIHNVRSYKYNDNAFLYNTVLENVFEKGFIDINGCINEYGLISDGTHLTKKTHECVYCQVKKVLEDRICVE